MEEMFLCTYVFLYRLATNHTSELSQYSVKVMTNLDSKASANTSMS